MRAVNGLTYSVDYRRKCFERCGLAGKEGLLILFMFPYGQLEQPRYINRMVFQDQQYLFAPGDVPLNQIPPSLAGAVHSA